MIPHKRWRKLKQQTPHTASPNTPKGIFGEMSLKERLRAIYATERIKAFITDIFMINMPLLYLTTYVFLDGKDAFTHNQSAILACGLCYGIITSLFFAFSSQTPGYRYMSIKLVREDGRKVSFICALIRYFIWIIGTSFLFGLLLGLFRKDGKCLHDLLCKTQILSSKSI